MNKEFDGWELPKKCKKCGTQDNHSKENPVTFLDVETELCEFCFDCDDEEVEMK